MLQPGTLHRWPPAKLLSVSVRMRSSRRLRSATNSAETRSEGSRGRGRSIGDLVHDLAGPRAHDVDAVGQEDRLVDVVGDEDHGLAQLAPDVQQPLLHEQAGLRVERAERLVEQQDVAREEHRADERRALAHAARELARQRGDELAEPEALAQLAARARAPLASRRPRPRGPSTCCRAPCATASGCRAAACTRHGRRAGHDLAVDRDLAARRLAAGRP